MIKPLISKIVVAVSGSDASISAAKYAILMAKLYHSHLSAVYVIDTATIRQLTLSKIFVPEESQEYEKNLEAGGERYLSFVEELARAKGVKIEKEMRRGAVYTEIINAADERNANLIILGGRGKDRNSRDIIAHVHREIMVNAKCSVLLVKEPAVDQLYKQA
ncbi:MAG: universal stress protein [Spirochaetaceae bacterium]|jgi:nucleotide-binding universal stress UspA family protein|nr:universal stress protein [Spirochaetaceae bacterium]